jgi:hypothetical protein
MAPTDAIRTFQNGRQQENENCNFSLQKKKPQNFF